MRIFLAGFLIVLFCWTATAAVQQVTPNQYYERATLQYLTGDLTAAANNLRTLLKIDPQYHGARELLNSILREKGLKIQAEPPLPPRAVLMPPPSPSLKNLPNLISDQLRLTIFGFGGAAITVFLIWLLSFLLDAVRRRRTRYCFNCRSAISLNIDQCPNCGAWIGAKMQLSISKAQRNWYKKVGWRRNPFTLDIHPELFTGFKDEVKLILEKISSESGHILITAPLGAGKTTILRWLLNQLVIDSFAIYVPRPPQEFSQLIKLIVEKMGVPQKEAANYDIYHLQALRKRVGKPLIILMDEAHEFTIEIEKPLRTLGDLDDVKLVMAGLPETVEKFQKEIRPLFERLVLNINLKPFDYRTFKDLIKARIEHFGGEGVNPFQEDALQVIYDISGGTPRKVIKACDWAVTRAIETGTNSINAQLLEDLRQAGKLDKF
jgi:type II secretory pathway predicted ATPase ExeA